MPRVNRREIFADAEIQVFQATLMRTNSTSHLDRMFDNLGRVLTASNSGTTNIPTTVQTNVYDANSRRTQQTATVVSVADYKNTWTWDNANRQTQVKQEGQTGGISVAAKRVDFTYNTGGMFTGVKRYNDLAGTQIVANTTYTYDLLARLTALDHKNASGGNLANYTWTFDNDRRITNFTNIDGYSSYTYDSNDQVTVVDHSYQTDETYTYDANGNRTNTGYTTGTNNRVTSDGTYNYTYDDEGNRISRTKISDSTKVEYTWDHRNRLTDVVFKTSGGTVTKKVQYQYDVFDRRIGKKIDADGNGTYESATYWVYDDAGKRDPNTRTSLDDIVLEFNDADGDGTGLATLTTRYLHGPQFDQVLASEASSGNVVTWALADHQGTVRDMVRYASGTTTVVNHRKFDAFGNLTAESDATVKFLYSYTGREWDGDAGLYYYRARWYDAKIGRFISEDPMGFAAGDANLNRYVENSPMNYTDPTGWQKTRNRDGTAPPLNARDYPEVSRFMATFRAMSNALSTGVYALNLETNQQVKTLMQQMLVIGGAANSGDWLDNLANLFAGWGDTLTFGVTDDIRNRFGINGGVDHNGGYYHAGQIVGNAHLGAISGAVTVTVVSAAAPAAAGALVVLGVSKASAVATVTTTLWGVGITGSCSTALNSAHAYQTGDWNQLAFNAGFLAGGFGQSYSNARPLANSLNAIVGQPPSTQPPGLNPIEYFKWADKNAWNPSLVPPGQSSFWTSMGTGPDPAGAGFTPVMGGAGIFSWINQYFLGQ